MRQSTLGLSEKRKRHYRHRIPSEERSAYIQNQPIVFLILWKRRHSLLYSRGQRARFPKIVQNAASRYRMYHFKIAKIINLHSPQPMLWSDDAVLENPRLLDVRS